MDTKTVKVTEVPGTPTTVVLNGGSETVSDALEAADMEASDGQEVQINGENADLDTEVADGDFVTLSQKISGSR